MSSTAAISAAAVSTAAPSRVIGLGTCCLRGQESEDQVLAGLKAGYRLIDTASHYKNEAEVANAIERAGLARSDVTIITKVWFDDMGDGTAEAIQRSLKELRTDYVDILLVHFPGSVDMIQDPTTNQQRRRETWTAFEAAHEAGVARTIGVANYTRKHLKELLGFCRTKPAINQLELHPYFPQTDLVDYCMANGVQPMAFSPLAHGDLRLLDDPVLQKIAAAHDATPAQVALSWSLSRGITPVVFTESAARLKENFTAASLELTEKDIDRISRLEWGDRSAQVGFNPRLIA